MNPEAFIESGALRLATYTWGSPGDKPVVVLVHGYPDSATVWQQTAEALAPHYRVIAYDVRGAGNSDAPPRVADYDMSLLVEDLAAVTDALAPDEPFHLVAHDWGSIQSWEAVTTERLAGRIASYTSISGPCLDHVAHWMNRRMRSCKPRDLQLLLGQLRRSWYIAAFQLPLLAPMLWKLTLGKRWPKVLAQQEGIHGHENPTQTRDGSLGVNLYRANFPKRMRKPAERRTEIPVQVIVPTRERFMVPQIWDDLERWVPKLWRREIEAGHWVPLSDPEALADMVGEFIDYVEGGAMSESLREAQLGVAA